MPVVGLGNYVEFGGVRVVGMMHRVGLIVQSSTRLSNYSVN